ncbi:hypothetical protein ACHAQA_004716 [Verticillium albo-atrum]
MAPGGFQFVHIANPADAANHRKQVRAHAARNSKVRREKVAKYQAQARDQEAPPASETPSQDDSPPTAVAHLDHDDSENPLPFDYMPIRPAGKPSPNPITLLSPARHDPFDSFIRPVAPFEGYLLNHFMHHVVMNDLSAEPCLNQLSNGALALHSALTWTQAAAVDMGMLALIFLVSCRSLAKLQHSTIYEPVALRYKAQCLRYLNATISREGDNVSDMTITKTLAMASEEFFSSNKTAADQHLRAAVQMVTMRRQPIMIGMWKHDDNLHLWSHWERVVAGQKTDEICLLQSLRDEDAPLSTFDELKTSPVPCTPSPPSQRRYDHHGPAFKPITLKGVDYNVGY